MDFQKFLSATFCHARLLELPENRVVARLNTEEVPFNG